VTTALCFMIATDILDKFEIIEKECDNLERSLFSFIKKIRTEGKKEDEDYKVDGRVKDMDNWPSFNYREKEHFFTLRGVRSIKNKIHTAKEAYRNYCKEMIPRLKNNSFEIYDAVSFRDYLTEVAKFATEGLRYYQTRLLQTRELSPTVYPLPDILRRVNLSSNSNVLSELARIQKHHINEFIENHYDKCLQAVPSNLKKALEEAFESADIVQLWLHEITSRYTSWKTVFNPLKSDKEDIHVPQRSYVINRMAYWTLELPVYIPILSHEISHLIIDKISIDRDKLDNEFSLAKFELHQAFVEYFRQNDMFVDHPDRDIDHWSRSMTEEIMADLLALYTNGPAFLMALFLQIVGIGGSAIFRKNENEDIFDVKDQYLLVPQHEGTPWTARLHLASEFCKTVYGTKNEKSLVNMLCSSIDIFLKEFDKSGEHKYQYSSILQADYSKRVNNDRELIRICSAIINKYIVRKFSMAKNRCRTSNSDNLANSLKVLLEKYLKDSLQKCIKCTDSDKDACANRIPNVKNATEYSRLEDVVWETQLALSFFTSECKSIGDAFDTEKRKNFPAGRRSFILALESYNFKSALHSSFLNLYCDELDPIKDAIQDGKRSLRDKINRGDFIERIKDFEIVQKKAFGDVFKILKDRKLNIRIAKTAGLQIDPHFKYSGAEIERKIMDGVTGFESGMNLCSISFCRRDLRAAPNGISIDNTHNDLLNKLPSLPPSYYYATLFGPYSFVALQDNFMPNDALLIDKIRERNVFEFHAKSKIAFEIKLFPKQDENTEILSGTESAFIRLKLKNRGHHFLLLNDIQTQEGEFEKNRFGRDDRFFISSGWEDIVILLQNRQLEEILGFQGCLFRHHFTDRLQTFFVRNKVGSSCDRNLCQATLLSTVRVSHPVSSKNSKIEDGTFKELLKNRINQHIKTGSCENFMIMSY